MKALRSTLSFVALLFTALAAICCHRSATPPPELRVIFKTEVLSLDPNEKFETVTDSYAINVFEPLLRFDWEASYVPVLATRWEIPDGKTWQFSIRPGVQFHDGSPLTASDVVFSIKRVLENRNSELQPYLRSIESVSASGPLAVSVVSTRPAGILAALSFVYVLPEKSFQKKGPEAFFQRPAGTGPYLFDSLDKGKALRLAANPGYWGPKPYFPRAEFKFLQNDEEGWAATQEHQPSIFIGPSIRGWARRKGLDRHELIARPGLSVQFLTVNIRPGHPLADLRVRKALRLALDLPSLVEKTSLGSAVPSSQFVSPGIVGYNPRLALVKRDLPAARKLLAEAGFARGLDLKITVSETQLELAGHLQTQLQEAGVRLSIESVSVAEQYERVQKCKYDLAVSGWICSTGDGAEILEGAFTQAGTAGLTCGYHNPTLERLVEEIARILDSKGRQRLLQKGMEILNEDLPWIPLYIPEERCAVSDSIIWEPRPDDEVYLPMVKPRSTH